MTIALRDSDDGVQDSSGTTCSTDFGFAVVAGDFIPVSVAWESTNTTVTVTDTIGNTYVPRTKRKSATNNQWVQVFDCLSSIGSDAANIVTATWGAAADYKSVDAASFSHDAGAMSFSNEGTAEVASGTAISASITPAGAGENLEWTAVKQFNAGTWAQYDGTWTPSTHLTTRLLQSSFKTVTGTGANSGGGSRGTNSNMTLAYAVYAEGGGGGASTDDDQTITG